jgi:formylmethanofuran dehydrogenase subunit B
MICTGCSCLCDDIVVDGGVRNACRRGAGIFRFVNEGRAKPMINGEVVDFEKAMDAAGDIIGNSEKLAVYGLDTTTVEAQQKAIELAKTKEAYIDDNSSFCLGDFVELILKEELPTTTLDEVRNNAYVVFYWGTDVYHSLSRHMSRFTYYPRGGKRQRGYEEDRFLVVVDVRRSHTAKLAKKNARFIEVGDDLELIDAILKVLDGKAPEKFAKDAVRIVKEMQKADFNVIIGGLGLKYGLKGDYQQFLEFVRRVNEVTNLYFIPAGCHPNMRGFNQLLFEKTGHVNRYSFRDEEAGEKFAFPKLLEDGEIDAALIVGTDPVNSLPFDIAKKLKDIKTILIDPRQSLTAEIADVVLPSAISGLETGGTMIRIDGVKVELAPFLEKKPDDVSIISSLLEAV